jgi:hypothetical protein
MFTRHFYRFDEVRAALLYSIMKGRALEVAFWTQELLDSNLSVWTILTEAWLWFSLATDPHWITERNDPQLAAYRLASGPKDNSLWAVLCVSPVDMPDTLCANVPKSMPYTKPCLEKYLYLALHQKKGLAACWAALRLGMDAFKQVTSLSLDLPQPLLICASVLWTCSRSIPEFRPSMNQEVMSHLAKWSTLSGRRSRRLYEIPMECLYGITKRGCMSQKVSTIIEIRRIHDILAAHITDDDALEAFYQATFPDDIPDEWSLEDQRKSHGQGILRTGEQLSLAKLGRIWFQAESRYAWGFYEWTKEDRFIEEGPLDFQLIADNLNTDHDIVVAALLEPVRKLLIAE